MGKSKLSYSFFVCLSIIMSFFMISMFNETQANAASKVTLTADTSKKTATMSNDYIQIKFNNTGRAYSLTKNGKELIGNGKGFYASIEGGTGFTANSLKVVTNTSEMVDIAYINNWGELHYVLRSDVSGVYSYFVTTGLGTVGEFRTVYRPDGNIFNHGYTNAKSESFPTLSDIKNGTKLQDETWQLPNGKIYTKYNWADYQADNKFYGVYGNNYGLWIIPASNEYYSSGPMRQELMVHLESATGDAVLLNMLNGSHFGMKEVTIPSGKVYGPWLIYVNNGDINDAKSKADTEEKSWPYKWLNNSNYPLSRTKVTGTLKLTNGKSTKNAMVVLAKPGSDFYTQGSDYIFYSKADKNGKFNIANVRPGKYTLYAYSTEGDVTDEFVKDNVVVSGSTLKLGTLNWDAKTYSNSLWTIGTADRSASEFKLGNLERQFGLPAKVPADLTYTIGSSSESKDWYFAQTKVGNWDVNFNLNKTYTGTAHLTVAMASISRNPNVDIYVNGTRVDTLAYRDENDQTTYRSANQSGRYRSQTIDFPASMLKSGNNTIRFRMSRVGTDGGIMYDMIKLETE